MKVLGKQGFILIGVLLMVSAGRISGHQGDRTYPIIELTDADLAIIDLQDGDIGDWEDIVAEPTLTVLDFFLWGSYDPASFDFRIWLGWHDATNRIYVAMEQIDNAYVNVYGRDKTSNGEFFMSQHDGSLNVAVDGDHSGGQYSYPNSDFDTYEEWALFSNREAQGYYALGEVFDQGTHIGTNATILLSQGGFEALFDDWFVQLPYALGGGGSQGESPTIAVTECYVTPFDRLVWNSEEESLVTDLQPGKIIGLRFRLADRDEPMGSAESAYGLPEFSAEFGSTADGFVDFALLGAGGVLPEDTSVENATWARIKASFLR